MQKVRQGILSRKPAQNNGRNQTTLDQQHQKEQQKLTQKQQILQNVSEHRRVVFDGTQPEKQAIHSQRKEDIDLQVKARREVLQDMKQFNQQQDQKQLEYFKYQARMDETKNNARREYQKQFMDENKKLVQNKVQTERVGKQNEWSQDNYNSDINYFPKQNYL